MSFFKKNYNSDCGACTCLWGVCVACKMSVCVVLMCKCFVCFSCFVFRVVHFQERYSLKILVCVCVLKRLFLFFPIRFKLKQKLEHKRQNCQFEWFSIARHSVFAFILCFDFFFFSSFFNTLISFFCYIFFVAFKQFASFE